MDIKIPSGPPEGRAVDAVKDASNAIDAADETSEAKEIASVATDEVSRIAEQVARGEIGRSEAVDRILAEVLDADIVKAAPKELREELSQVLTAQLETDPHLRSLVAALGPKDSD
ncbi:MAG: hypothetical protein GY847_36440 [Proteobacteria bacterium]|nr:hypothetical protein [Pseudomonadota bacterium]